LADLHLVEPAGRKRYRLHDLVHAYATHRAHIDEEPETCREAVGRLVSWYARAAQHADQVAFSALDAVAWIELAPVAPEIAFEMPTQALAWLNDERANLVAAAGRAAELGLQDVVLVLAVSSRFLTVRQHSLTLLYLEVNAQGVATARAGGNRAVEAFLLSQQGSALCYVGRLAEADTALTHALTLAEELNDRAGQVFALSGLGRVRLEQDRLAEARDYYQQALPLAVGLGKGRAEAVVHCNLSQICTRLGEHRQALEHADRELVLRKQVGDRIGEAYAMYDAALAWQGLGDHDTAIGLCRRTLDAYRAMGNTGDRFVDPLLALAISLEHTGDVAGAAEALSEAVDVLVEFDDPRAPESRRRLADLESRIASDRDR
jgi:tetratricopeptide (TPR) repeat protein